MIAMVPLQRSYLQAAFDALAARGTPVQPELMRHVAPLGWEHIGLTGDYVWAEEGQPGPGLLRPLRERPSLLCRVASSSFARAGRSEHFRVLTPAWHDGEAGAAR